MKSLIFFFFKSKTNDIFYIHRFRVCAFEGKTLRDVEKSWTLLERAEHERERALQEALRRLEQLEQLAQQFGRKVTTASAETETFKIRWHFFYVLLVSVSVHVGLSRIEQQCG